MRAVKNGPAAPLRSDRSTSFPTRAVQGKSVTRLWDAFYSGEGRKWKTKEAFEFKGPNTSSTRNPKAYYMDRILELRILCGLVYP